MKHQMVTASGRKASAKKHKIRKMEIEPAANGFSVTHHFHAPDAPEGKAGMYMEAPPSEQHVFGSADEMACHVGQCFGAKASKGEKAPAKQDVRSGKKEADKEEANEDEG